MRIVVYGISLLVSLVIGPILYSAWRKRQEAAQLEKLRWAWGRPKSPPAAPEFEKIRLFDTLKRYTSGGGLDDKTWDDLDLDLVFQYLDRTTSRVGQQFLFHLLRNPRSDEESLLKLEHTIKCFLDVNLCESLQTELYRLNHRDALFLPHLFLSELPRFKAQRFVFLALSVMTFASVVGAFFSTGFRIIAVLLVITNMIVSMYYQRRLEAFIQPLHLLNELINIAGRIASQFEGSQISDHTEKLKEKVMSLSGLRRKTALFSFPRSPDDLMAAIYDYLNKSFLLDLICFAFAVEELDTKREDVAAIFEALGYLDAAISIVSVRQGKPNFTTPVFITRRKACRFTHIYHPLLASPVPNDLTITGKSILLTGSNMSGKSTFVRTIGVNAVLAQTIHTCFAAEYRAPFLEVRACMGATDSLTEGKSYYFAEVENVLAVVTATQSERQCLILLDELFRGTNTVERVAAAKAILEYLNRGDNLVIIATHDIELAELLERQYESHHFREIIYDKQMSFDYKLQRGTSSTRNAIAILGIYGYPKEIVNEALGVVDQLAQRKSKTTKHWFFG